jgi:hypothetical protein
MRAVKLSDVKMSSQSRRAREAAGEVGQGLTAAAESCERRAEGEERGEGVGESEVVRAMASVQA